MMLIQMTGLIIVLIKQAGMLLNRCRMAKASQTGDPENVSNAIEQSAYFWKFDSESSNDDVIRYIPKIINKSKKVSRQVKWIHCNFIRNQSRKVKQRKNMGSPGQVW